MSQRPTKLHHVRQGSLGTGGQVKSRLATSLLKLCSKASTKRGELGMSFVEGTI